MSKLISIKKAAEQLHASQNSLREWEKQGKLSPVYTAGGHRRYKQSDIDLLTGDKPKEIMIKNRCAIYARVSTGEQKKHGDLDRQISRLSSEAINRQLSIVAIISEVASGMNDKRLQLHKMMNLAINKQIDVVLIEHKDRLTRFMFDYLVKFFESHEVKIIWTDEILGKSYEQELVEDILSLMASFSAKIYSRRAVKNRIKKKEKI
jgi:predicted site-specific integrase-resolvase